MADKLVQDRELTPAEKARAARLLAARTATGLGQAAFCREHRITYDTYRSHESGRRPVTKPAAKQYAKALGRDWRELYGLDDDDEGEGLPPTIAQAMPVEMGQRDLPVFGRGVGGKEGWFEFNGQRIDTIFRPPVLGNVRDAYAIFMDGESMVPKFDPGDTLYVHPGRPVRAGHYVVVQLAPKESGDPIRALIKLLVSNAGDQVTLRSLNPPGSKPFKIARNEVMHIHKIVLSGEG